MKRRRRRDILRVQLVRIFELLADAGVISQTSVETRPDVLIEIELHMVIEYSILVKNHGPPIFEFTDPYRVPHVCAGRVEVWTGRVTL